jgi:hypothetical protein
LHEQKQAHDYQHFSVAKLKVQHKNSREGMQNMHPGPSLKIINDIKASN